MSGTTSQVIVVGGGFAGLVAGARAAELGLGVTLLERGTGAHYPCNARWSGGVLHVGYHDIAAGAGRLEGVIDRATGAEADPRQAGTFAAGAGRLIDWLQSHGATFVGTKVDWQQFILEPMRAMRAGLDWEGRGPDRMMTRLAAAIRQRGGHIVLGARARALTTDAGRCTGVEADVDGASKTFAGRAVLLADGGFQANLERLDRHITRHPLSLKQRGAANGTGDGLAMAEAVGAAIAGMDRFYGHLLSRDAFTNDGVWPYPELDALALSGILVDAGGRRLADEGVGGVALTNALARAADPLGATIIFDRAIWEGPGRSARIPANPTLAAAGGTVHAAPTLPALAEAAGLPATALADTVATYNAALAAGTLDGLVPPRSSDRHRPMPITDPPFHAIPVCAGITYTMGGLVIDGEGRVVRKDGTAIAGLYAAGSNTGGLEGGSRVAYLGGLAKAGVQGLTAAEAIAKHIGG